MVKSYFNCGINSEQVLGKKHKGMYILFISSDNYVPKSTEFKRYFDSEKDADAFVERCIEEYREDHEECDFSEHSYTMKQIQRG